MDRLPRWLRHLSGKQAELDASRAIVRLAQPLTHDAKLKALDKAGLTIDEGEHARRVNHTPSTVWARSGDSQFIKRDQRRSLEKLLGKGLAWVGPVYRLVDTTGLAGAFGVAPQDIQLVWPLKPPRAHAAMLEKSLDGFEAKGHLKLLVDPDRPIDIPVELATLPGHEILDILEVLEDLEPKPFYRCKNAIPLLDPRAGCSELPPGPTLWDCQEPALVDQLCVDQAWCISSGNTSTTKGSPDVHVAVIDTGFDLEHGEFGTALPGGGVRALRLYHDPDIIGIPRAVYTPPDAFLDERDMPDGGEDPHGTAVLGLMAALWDSTGLTGVVGRCSIFALKTEPDQNQDSVLRCLMEAVGSELGTARRVIVLPSTHPAYASGAFDAAIAPSEGDTEFRLIIAPSGNVQDAPIAYPATHPAVMTVGAVDALDRRLQDGSTSVWSQYGSALSVVAPGHQQCSTDLQGAPGASPDDYIDHAFSGTSAAAAYVGGVAAMLFSHYPTLTATRVRSIIERTADKITTTEIGATDPYEYEETAEVCNPRDLSGKVGFGRVNAYHAMDFAEVMIRDNPDDDGTEPATGNMWRDADVIVRPTDEGDLSEASFEAYRLDAALSRRIVPNADNWIYVRVFNKGPATARQVEVTVTVAAPSTGFGYPDDWNPPDGSVLHGVAVDEGGGNLAALPADSAAILKLRLPMDQVANVAAWGGHGCALAEVVAENDYAFQKRLIAGSGAQRRSNNLIQRNVNVVEPGSPWRFAFTVGNPLDLDPTAELLVDAGGLPAQAPVQLLFDDPQAAFPHLDLSQAALEKIYVSPAAKAAYAQGAAFPRRKGVRSSGAGFRALNRAKLETSLGGVRGVLTMEPGSTFSPMPTRPDHEAHEIRAMRGSEVVLRDDKRRVTVRDRQAAIVVEKLPNQVLPVLFEAPVPAHAQPGDTFPVDIVQRRPTGEVVGGITLLLVVP